MRLLKRVLVIARLENSVAGWIGLGPEHPMGVLYRIKIIFGGATWQK